MLPPPKKPPRGRPWYLRTEVPWGRTLVLVGLCAGLAVALHRSPLGRFLSDRLEKRFSFFMRERLGQEPLWHPRLKVYWLDSDTLAYVDLEAFPLVGWTAVLKEIAAHKPARILVDKAFSFPPLQRQDIIDGFRETLRGSPLVGTVTVLHRPIRHREQSAPGCCGFEEAAWAEGDFTLSPRNNLESAPRYLYGPHTLVQPAFSALGHLVSLEGGYTYPVIRLQRPETTETLYVPHWALRAADRFSLKENELTVQDRPVALNPDGTLLPNIISNAQFESHSESLLPLVKAVKNGKPFDSNEPGDVVVVLATMQREDRQYFETPVGPVPLAQLAVSLVNSVLTGEWLAPLPFAEGTLVVSSAVGALLGASLPTFWVAPVAAAVALGLVALGVSAFVYHLWLAPWLLWGLTVFLVAVTLLYLRLRRKEAQAARIRHSLAGAVDPAKLEEIARAPESLRFEPSEQPLTVLFLDIVGFARTAESRSPGAVFQTLKELTSLLTPLVHAHGGIVDKTTGDGLLCYFGYRFLARDYERGATNHPSDAVACGVAMQRAILERNQRAAALQQPILPVRIGIHTESVFIGDIGAEGRIEFTVIGNGVNFAQRLEAACDPYHLLIGPTTRDRLDPRPGGVSVQPKLISIKHHDELVEAFEVDPFAEMPELLVQAVDAYRKSLGIERGETRWPIEENLPLGTPYGPGRLINFSKGGLQLHLPRYFGTGTTFAVDLSAARLGGDTGLPQQLMVEVRWGKPAEGGGYLHGARYRNLTGEQKDALFLLLRGRYRGADQPMTA